MSDESHAIPEPVIFFVILAAIGVFVIPWALGWLYVMEHVRVV